MNKKILVCIGLFYLGSQCVALNAAQDPEEGTLGGTGKQPGIPPDVLFDKPEVPEPLELPEGIETPEDLDVIQDAFDGLNEGADGMEAPDMPDSVDEP